MTRLLRVAPALLLLVLTMPSPAEAGLLSWLDRLSGPGPFWGVDAGICLKCFMTGERSPEKKSNEKIMGETLRFGCRDERLDVQHLSWLLNAGVAGTIVNKLNYGDRPEPEPSTAVGVVTLGTSIDYTLAASLDVGVGGGFMYFAGPSFINFARPYVQPLRLTIRPLLVRWTPQPNRKDEAYLRKLRHRSVLLVNVNVNVLVGTIRGADFGAPADPFRVHNEVVPEIGIGVDVPTLLELIRR